MIHLNESVFELDDGYLCGIHWSHQRLTFSLSRLPLFHVICIHLFQKILMIFCRDVQSLNNDIFKSTLIQWATYVLNVNLTNRFFTTSFKSVAVFSIFFFIWKLSLQHRGNHMNSQIMLWPMNCIKSMQKHTFSTILRHFRYTHNVCLHTIDIQ